MNKKRKLALILTSPLILLMILMMALVSVLMYAMNGKWEFKDCLRETFGDDFMNALNKIIRRSHAKSKD